MNEAPTSAREALLLLVVFAFSLLPPIIVRVIRRRAGRIAERARQEAEARRIAAERLRQEDFKAKREALLKAQRKAQNRRLEVLQRQIEAEESLGDALFFKSIDSGDPVKKARLEKQAAACYARREKMLQQYAKVQIKIQQV